VLSVSPATHGLQVLSFDGHRGEQLLGLATSKATSATKPTSGSYAEIPADARVFAPDGSELANAGNLLSGHALTLPADGTYKFVLQMHVFSLQNLGDVTVTIWDVANAPAEAKKDRGSSTCDYTLFGSSCSSGYSSSSGTLVGPSPTSSIGRVEICTTVPKDAPCSMTIPTVMAGPPPTAVSGTSIGGGIGATGNGTGTSVAVTPSTVARGGGNSRSSTATSSLPHG
jgi:hypothetical protein